MFFDSPEQIPEIAAQTNCSIFTINPNKHKVQFSNSTIITPLKDKVNISIEQIRDLIQAAQTKHQKPHFFILTPADAMTKPAANALLKTIEQPPDNCHFVLLTKMPSTLLPTILSRSQIYYLRKPIDFYEAPKASPQVKKMAKQLLTATPNTLPNLAEQIASHKPNSRQFALNIVATAIEMLYKTFCQTHQSKWLERLPQFITLYDNLNQNGHVKLHLVADLC